MRKKLLMSFVALLIVFNLFRVNAVFSTQSESYESTRTMLQELLKFFSLFGLEGLPSNNSSGTSGGSGEGSGGGDGSTGGVSEAIEVKSMRELFTEIEGKVGVPVSILEAVFWIESPSQYKNFSPEEIQYYSQPDIILPNCRVNLCSAAGPMQMTTGEDDRGSSECRRCGLQQCPNAWLDDKNEMKLPYKDAVAIYDGARHMPNYCNFRDNIYASAAKLRSDSSTKGSLPWNQQQVYQAAERYYGSCADKFRYPRLEGRTYCEFLWWYYSTHQ